MSEFSSHSTHSSGVQSSDDTIASAMSHLQLGAVAAVTTVPYIATMLQDVVGFEDKIKKREDLIARCQLLQLIYKVARRAIENVQKQKYAEFDALVSDCACQMRALFVAKYARQCEGDDTMQKENKKVFDEMGEKIKAVETFVAASDKKKPIQATTFKDLIAQQKMDMDVPQDICTLARCVLLYSTKQAFNESEKPVACSDCGVPVKGYQEETNPENMEVFFGQKGAAKNKLKKVVDQARVALAQTSCAFIMKQARQVPDGVLDDVTKELLQEKNIRVITGRQELPAYATLTTVFQAARYEKNPIPVLLKVRKAAHTVVRIEEPYDVQLFLKPASTGGSFVTAKPTKEEMNVPVLVVEGQRCGKAIKDETTAAYIKRLFECNFMSLFKGFGAAHKQYSKWDAAVPSFEAVERGKDAVIDEFFELHANAKKAGCSPDNQSLISFTHIYCDTLSNQKAVITEGS
ncbi:MAG TPA: hypothetical protein VN457_01355 [Chlamydiales bacterium]|nr:hypothetical protein [Chlamydiales bacterium]